MNNMPQNQKGGNPNVQRKQNAQQACKYFTHGFLIGLNDDLWEVETWCSFLSQNFSVGFQRLGREIFAQSANM
jgi:hypothetical protein